ncbi:MAG TPA: trehalose-phosphatase [Pilimelia sp.]|nr:trehalose-phosphatase [Pilimelia sp.]
MRHSERSGGRVGSPWTPQEAWRATATRAPGCHLFFDFDGTLAPIADDPSAVYPAPGVVAAIAELAGAVGHVAIVSARPVEFLRDRFADLPAAVDLYGLYGLQVHRAGQTHTDPTALDWAPAMAQLADRARAELPGGDEVVEFKRLSVALHYRTTPELGERVEAWARAEATRLGLRVQSGRMVVEVKPPGGRDKGTVIAEAVCEAACAWYFGDDLSDIKAFQSLRARAAAEPDFFGVCVAVANPETGQELSAAADLTLASPAALADFLHGGAAELRRAPAA